MSLELKDKPARSAASGKSGVSRPPRKRPTVSRAVQERIGEQLRAMYDGLRSEPIPERFLDLVKQMDVPEADQDR